MASAIDETIPLPTVDTSKQAFRDNWSAAKNEIEQLQGRFGARLHVVLEADGAELSDKLDTVLAAVAADPGSHCVLLPPGDYAKASQYNFPTHAGETTLMLGWGMPRVRRTSTGTDETVLFGSGAGSLEIRGVRGESAASLNGYFLIPSGELESVRVESCRFVDSPDMIAIRANRGGIRELVFSHNYCAGIQAGVLTIPSDTTFGTLTETIDISHNTTRNLIGELFSIDRGNGGAHGPANAKNLRAIGNAIHTDLDTIPALGYAAMAVSSTENVIISGNTIYGYSAVGIRLEDVSRQFVVSNNTIQHGLGWPIAVTGQRWWEYCGIFLLDCVDGIVQGNVLADSVYAALGVENNPLIGRAKRIIIADNIINGAGYAGILASNSPDTQIVAENDVFEPTNDASIRIAGNTISHVTEAFAATGLWAREQCGVAIRMHDYDATAQDNTILECTAWLARSGRLPRSSTFVAGRQTCRQEVMIEPTATVSGIMVEGDLARGTVVEAGGFAGWIDVMDVGAVAHGTLDIGIGFGDANYARRLVDLTVSAGAIVSEADHYSQEAGTVSGLALQLAADGRTLQARAATTSAAETHEWSAVLRGPRLITAPSAIIDRTTEYYPVWADFDGASDILGPSALTVGDQTSVTFSCWVTGRASPWANEPVYASGVTDEGMHLWLQGNARIGFFFDYGDGGYIQTVTGLLPGATYHVLVSADSTTQTAWMRINGRDLADPALTLVPPNAVVMTDDTAAIGAFASGSFQSFDGQIADLWIAPVFMPDPDASLALFRGLHRQPRWLGATGELPLVGFGGGDPAVFLSGGMERDISTWHTNRGTAGGFTLNGDLAP